MQLSETKLVTLFYYELWWLSNSIVKNCESIFFENEVPDDGFVIQVQPETHAKIAAVLSDAANIKKIITEPSVKLSGDNGERFRLRKERARELRGVLESLNISEILNHKVRNTLEHFGEYLDEANYEITKKGYLGTVAAYNMVISHWEVTVPKVYPIRLYVSSEKKFYNMKWSVDMGLISVEANLIVEKLRQMPSFSDQEPGGLMIPI